MEYFGRDEHPYTTLEREVKLRFGSVEEARTAVTALGAAPLRCRRLQEDALLDDARESLRSRRCVLRVRVESGRSLLTFKGPVQPSPVKVREEIERSSATARPCCPLGAARFSVWFRYRSARKSRSATPSSPSTTPIGVFVEIGAPEHGIIEATRARQAAGRLRPRPSIALHRARRAGLTHDRHAVRGRGVWRLPTTSRVAPSTAPCSPRVSARAGADHRPREPTLPVAGPSIIERIVRGSRARRHRPHRQSALPAGAITALLATAPGARALPGAARARAGRPRRGFSRATGDSGWSTTKLTGRPPRTCVSASKPSLTIESVTMAVIPNPNPSRYGGVAIDDGAAVTGFSRRGATGPSWHFVGVQIAERPAFERLPDGVPAESVGALYPSLIAERPGSVRASRAGPPSATSARQPTIWPPVSPGRQSGGAAGPGAHVAAGCQRGAVRPVGGCAGRIRRPALGVRRDERCADSGGI